MATQESIQPSIDQSGVEVNVATLDLRKKIDKCRAYVWMHSQCKGWSSLYSVIIAIIQSVASYAAGSIGLATSDNNSTLYLSVAFSFFVAVVSTIAKLKYFNFDGIAEQHSAAINSWNDLWSKIEVQENLSESNKMTADEFTKLISITFASLESMSENVLPLWVRSKCLKAFINNIPRENLPDMCKDPLN